MSDFNWNFKPESGFESIAAGDHRLRVASCEKAVSQKGNDMLVLKFAVSGYAKQIWHYIVFLPDKPEITNRMLTQFFDSFDIERGNFNMQSYIGKTGAARVKIDENGYEKISYFLSGKKKDELPAWKEPKTNQAGVTLTEVTDNADDLPF